MTRFEAIVSKYYKLFFKRGLNKNHIPIEYDQRLGSLVVEQGTHNPKVTGSIPVRANTENIIVRVELFFIFNQFIV